ncbi:MAG TPA: phosphoserine phosphatase SerB [Dongiaceae bacterium]
MAQVLTLISGIGTALDEPSLAAARATLREAGAEVGPVSWLAPDQACDIPFSGGDPHALETALRRHLTGLPVDLAIQPAKGRRKRLLLADMESTIVTRELTDELAGLAGMGEAIAAMTAASMRGEVDFAASLRARIAMLKGQPAALLERVKDLVELSPGARALVQTMKAHGARTALVSGGFDCFAAIAAAACGFDELHANRLVMAEDRIAGEVVEPILDRLAKRATLDRLAADLALAPSDTAAVGDGANDIPMIEAAGLGVAYHGKPVVAAAARFRLDHADLTGILFLQGYRAQEFQG